MANTLIPIEERNLTPEEVEALDRRRRRGQLFLVICGQCLIVAVLVTLWAGQDLTYSPGWARPMFYWDAVLFLLAAVFFVAGIRLRRGSQEFLSY
jgi:predicted membrane channel-forming protein YqfA (hemolysin III family)